MPFWISIGILGLIQAALVALPGRLPPLPGRLAGLRGRWWALVPAASIVVVIVVIELTSTSATALSYLALVSVPPLAALALARLVRGARPSLALAVPPLFALAWAAPGALSGDAASTALTALGCVTLGWLLASAVPGAWLRIGVYAMAVLDTCFVAADLLQGPNAVLNTAAPIAELPRLQAIHFGSARMGFGDFFVAAVVGCLLARRDAGDPPTVATRPRPRPNRQLMAAAIVALLALAFDLLFFVVDELPATVPVAVALALVSGGRARGARNPSVQL